MAYNPNTQTFLEFGGQDGGTNQNTTYTFTPATRTWTLLNPPTKPPGRINIETGLVFDEARNVFVLFGGRLQATPATNDTWTFDPTTSNWTQRTPAVSPPARDLHAMVYDRANRVVILHGGRSASAAILDDTWVYDTGANTWTQIAPSGTPPRIHHHSAVYDSVNNAMVVVPGNGTSDTFVFKYASGAPTAPPATPVTPSTPVPATPTAALASPSPVTSPQNTPTAGPIPSPPPPGARIDIPLRTFVVRTLPPTGQAPGRGGVKHTRMVFNSDDHRLYTMSGDWSGPCTGAACDTQVAVSQSYRNEIFSYDVLSDTWRRETDYCMFPNVQPGHPDYNGVAYDSLRKLFWMHGGYQQGAGSPDNCAQHNYTRNEMMWWSPVSKLWDGPQGRPSMFSATVLGTPASLTKSAFHDAVTDKLIWPTYDGRSAVLRYHIPTNTWTKTRFNSGNGCVDEARLGDVGLATWDPINRIIFVLEQKNNSTTCPGGYKRIWKINVECIESSGGSIASCLAWEDLPTNVRAGHDHERVVWDSVNNVLLYPFHGGQGWDPNQFQFSVWTPASGYPATWTQPGTWEVLVDYVNGIQAPTDPPNHCPYPQGAECNCTTTTSGCSASANCCLVRGSQVAFDPAQNVMIMYGGSEPWTSYLYLFRYGDGASGGPPSAPNLL